MNAHYLPRCYLRGFVDPAGGKPRRIWVHTFNLASWESRRPDEVATLPDYYAITRPDGTKDQAWETRLGRLENAVAPILRRIARSDAFSDVDMEALITFAGIMYLRLPVVHESLSDAMLPGLRSILQHAFDG